MRCASSTAVGGGRERGMRLREQCTGTVHGNRWHAPSGTLHPLGAGNFAHGVREGRIPRAGGRAPLVAPPAGGGGQ